MITYSVEYVSSGSAISSGGYWLSYDNSLTSIIVDTDDNANEKSTDIDAPAAPLNLLVKASIGSLE